MSRIRSLKPQFFKNEELADLSPLHRLLFAGLWTLADWCGRLHDRPKRIRVEVLPYDNCDVDAMLDDLQAKKFIKRYTANGSAYIWIVNFEQHQFPHKNEKAIPSTIPAFKAGMETVKSPSQDGTKTVSLPSQHPIDPPVKLLSCLSVKSVNLSLTDLKAGGAAPPAAKNADEQQQRRKKRTRSKKVNDRWTATANSIRSRCPDDFARRILHWGMNALENPSEDYLIRIVAICLATYEKENVGDKADYAIGWIQGLQTPPADHLLSYAARIYQDALAGLPPKSKPTPKAIQRREQLDNVMETMISGMREN